jgi:predicted molibdopterin-dependent oxidoreductase YjgC
LRWALLIITGSLDRPGGMRFNPISAEPLAGKHWSGHFDPDNCVPGPPSRPELRGMFGERPSVALVDEIEAGNIRTLFVTGGNPMQALPDPERTRAALRKLEMLIVADTFENELTSMATHVLAPVWHLERQDIWTTDHVQYTDAVIPAATERKPSWWFYGQLAKRLGVNAFAGLDVNRCAESDMIKAYAAMLPHGAEAVIRSGTHGRNSAVAHGWVHDKVLPDGKWRLAPTVLVDRLAGIWHSDGVIRLVTGRVLQNTNSAAYSKAMHNDYGVPVIHLSADAAFRIDANDGQAIRVTSKSGSLEGRAFIDKSLGQDSLWIGYGRWDRNSANLTDGRAVDPLTGQPVMSAFAVEVTLCADQMSPEQ